MRTWKLAAVQMDVRFADTAYNLAAIRTRLEQAADSGAKLVIFPECVLTGYSYPSKESAWPHAQTIPGPATQALGEGCRRLGIWTVVGLLERDGERLFNSCVLVGPGGESFTYRKVHLPCLGVDRFTTPGDRPFAVHDLGGLRVGMNICYDAGFPEAARVLTLLGADLIVLPTNWPEGSSRVPRYLISARALENCVYYAGANRIGEEGGFRFCGMSRIANVNGDFLAVSESAGEEILFAEIDPERARQKRIVLIPGEYELDRVGHRRPEMYRPLV